MTTFYNRRHAGPAVARRRAAVRGQLHARRGAEPGRALWRHLAVGPHHILLRPPARSPGDAKVRMPLGRIKNMIPRAWGPILWYQSYRAHGFVKNKIQSFSSRFSFFTIPWFISCTRSKKPKAGSKQPYTVETAYKVAMCPIVNLLYKRICSITDLKLLWRGLLGLQFIYFIGDFT